MPKHIVVIEQNGEVQKRYSPASPLGQRFPETFLQKLIFDEPSLLLTDQINPEYSKLIPISREVQVRSGSIDVLYVTLDGKICLVETKLWRNPEAHRTVVAQIIDYAKDLSRLSFEVFCEAVMKRKGESAIKLFFNKVKQKQPECNEIDLQEKITQSLSHGHFLLMIVGDKIYPQVALLADSIKSAPHLEFTIGLSELEFYDLGVPEDKQFLVVPQILGKTCEQERAIVRIIYEEKKPQVEVTPLEIKNSLQDKENFIKDLDGNALAVFKPILDLAEQKGFAINWGSIGFSMKVDIDGNLVALIMGYPKSSNYSQTIYTYIPSVITKINGGKQLADSFKQDLTKTGLFKPAGSEMKYAIKQKPTEAEIEGLMKAITDFAELIQKNGLIVKL